MGSFSLKKRVGIGDFIGCLAWVEEGWDMGAWCGDCRNRSGMVPLECSLWLLRLAFEAGLPGREPVNLGSPLLLCLCPLEMVVGDFFPANRPGTPSPRSPSVLSSSSHDHLPSSGLPGRENGCICCMDTWVETRLMFLEPPWTPARGLDSSSLVLCGDCLLK